MILRVCVVIPTFDNPRTISSVVKDAVLQTDFPILIVDDGSETPVENVLYSFEVKQALEEGRVRVVRFAENRGKGLALQYAIKDLVDHGFTHMFTMDGDGQHLAREIPKLVELAKAHPWDLIIGNRRLKSATVPEISKFGRKFSNFWVSYQTGLRVRDSQSGFRLYPLFPLQTLKFFTGRYDFEIEVLIRLMWRGVKVRECEIDVIYPEGKERVSHFHKFWDNARISLLNTMLVVISLLNSHRSARELALAVGLGVFVGTTPFFGFHSFIVAALAFVFRLNFVAMWLGSQVSIPPLAPLLILGSVFVGSEWLELESHFTQWLAGSFLLGAGLGLAAGLITLVSVWWTRRNGLNRTNWSGRTRGGRLGNGFLKLVINRFGVEWGYFCLNFIVPYFWLFAPTGRRGLNEYYKLLRPGWSWGRRQKEILRHFYRFGQVLMDRLYQGFRGGQQFPTKPEGMHHILEASQRGTGLIMLGAHMGAWDLAAALLGTHGFSDQMHVVEFVSKGLNFQKLKEKMDPGNVRTVNSGGSDNAIFEIHQALNRGQTLGLMGDRPLGDRFELIPFLGKLAPFDMTAFRLAAALRVPLLVTFGFKGKDNYYDFYARAPREYIFAPDAPRELQLYNWASEYVREVEKLLVKYPEQWFNFYPFWSSLPVAPNGQLASQGNNNLLEELHRPRTREVVPVLVPLPSDATQLEP